MDEAVRVGSFFKRPHYQKGVVWLNLEHRRFLRTGKRRGLLSSPPSATIVRVATEVPEPHARYYHGSLTSIPTGPLCLFFGCQRPHVSHCQHHALSLLPCARSIA